MPPFAGYDILVIPGQSNAVGYGGGTASEGDSQYDGQIFQIGRDGTDDYRIIPAKAPLQFWSHPGPELHGYALPLARHYAEYIGPDRRVLIVPAAQGGTSILQWLGIITGTGADLYGDMKSRLEFALTLPGDAQIVGWFESQGEGDIAAAIDPYSGNHALMPDAATYYARKLDLIDQFRGDFGEVPMFFGMPPDEWLPSDTVKEAFKVAITDAAGARDLCAGVDTTGFPSNPFDSPIGGGTVHYDAEGQAMLAQAYMDAFTEMASV